MNISTITCIANLACRKHCRMHRPAQCHNISQFLSA